jgi:hypothetical protein
MENSLAVSVVGLRRPFQLKALYELLEKAGKIEMWGMDAFRTTAYVIVLFKYSNQIGLLSTCLVLFSIGVFESEGGIKRYILARTSKSWEIRN